MDRRSIIPVALSLLVLSLLVWGCTPTPLASSQIIDANSSAISIEAGSWVDPGPVAEAHCDKFGKRAVFVGKQRLSDWKVTDLFAYDCKNPVAE